MTARALTVEILFVLFLQAVSAAAQTEQIANGGFESGSLSPWEYLGLAQDPPPGIVSTNQAHTGTYSLQAGGFTAYIVRQNLSPAVVPAGDLSFWVYVPAVIDPCEFDPYCQATPAFSTTVKYKGGAQQTTSHVGQLTGTGWKEITVFLDQSGKVTSITLTTAEIKPLYIDDVSLPGSNAFSWTTFLPALIR